jgi:hypothetical protein
MVKKIGSGIFEPKGDLSVYFKCISNVGCFKRIHLSEMTLEIECQFLAGNHD